MDKVTLIRSVSHPYPIHGVAYATTGIPRIEIPMELNPRDPAHWPFIGSVVDHVDGKRQAGRARRLGRLSRATWCCPGRSAASASGEVARAGPYGGFLGQAFDPICTEFSGKGTKTARKTLTDQRLGRPRALSRHHAREPVSVERGHASSGPTSRSTGSTAFDAARTARAPSPP